MNNNIQPLLGTYSIYNRMIEHLFPNIKSNKSDYLRHFFDLKLHLNNKKTNGNKYPKPDITRGLKREAFIQVYPTSNIVRRDGDQVYNKLLEQFSKKYWLLALWTHMYSNTSNYKIGREITRAFIKNCICQATLHLITEEVGKINEGNIGNNLPREIAFYKKCFNLENIIKNMRINERNKLTKILNKNKIDKSSIKTPLQIEQTRNTLSKYNLNCYSGILITLSDYELREEHIEIITLEAQFHRIWSHFGSDRKLKKELKSALS